MSNKFRKLNIEKYDSVYNNYNRTPYDQLMNLVYDPANVKMHPAPWPMERTKFDLNLQKKFCITDCGFGDEDGIPPENIQPNEPGFPTLAPEYPTIAPEYPTIAPEYPTPAPTYTPTYAPTYSPTYTPGYSDQGY
jgi:hypothetical protein